jgi:acetyltransferase-like isoleucine patch superfamily enzyme
MSHLSQTISFLAAVLMFAMATPSHPAPAHEALILAAAARDRTPTAQQRAPAAQQRAPAAQQRSGNASREAQPNRSSGTATANRRSVANDRQVRSSATDNINHSSDVSANVNRSASVNRNVNVNSNVNVNRNVDVNVRHDYYDGWDDHWHPVAAAAAVTATAMAVGAIVNSIPPSCQTVVVGGVSYSQCGNTWYRPQYAGTAVQYVVVSPPR